MKIEILSDVAISPNLAEHTDCMCAYPNAVVRDDGRVFCTYRQGSTKHGPDGIVRIQHSDDRGGSWSAPSTVFDRAAADPPETATASGIAIAGNKLIVTFYTSEMLDPDVHVFDEAAEAFPHHAYVCESTDWGETWSAPQCFDISPHGGARCGIGASPYALPDGQVAVILEVCIGPQATAAVPYHPGDRTFSPAVMLAGDETGELSLCDARITRLRDGTYLMHLWTFINATEHTIAVHQSRSEDGLRWSTPVPTGIQGQISSPLELEDGVVIAAVNHREDPEGSQLWWTTDDAETWCTQPLQLWDLAVGRMTGQPAVPRRHKTDDGLWDKLTIFTFGTPGLVQLDDGTCLFTYWAMVDGITHSRACRFAINTEKRAD